MEHAKSDTSLKMKNKKYLLDTNVLIDFMDGVPEVVELNLHGSRLGLRIFEYFGKEIA